jgi:hypothetical protein
VHIIPRRAQISFASRRKPEITNQTLFQIRHQHQNLTYRYKNNVQCAWQPSASLQMTISKYAFWRITVMWKIPIWTVSTDVTTRRRMGTVVVSDLYRRQCNERDGVTWNSSGCWNDVTVYSNGNIRSVWHEKNRGSHFERKKQLKKLTKSNGSLI